MSKQDEIKKQLRVRLLETRQDMSVCQLTGHKEEYFEGIMAGLAYAIELMEK